MKKQVVLVVAASFSLAVLPVRAQVTVDSFEAKTYKSPNGGELLYRQLNPLKMESGKKYPLVLFLHGAGGRGTNNIDQIVDAGFCPRLINSVKFTEEYPCFMIAPQVPPTNRWVEVHWGLDSHSMPDQPGAQLRMAMELVEQFTKENPVDVSRLYITGLSMGGFGTWDAIQRHPEMFAAAVPVCGGGDTDQAAKLARIPIWTYHGDKDGVVKTQRSRDMIEAIKKAGGNPLYTELKNVGHNAWNDAYGKPEMWKWMFEQKKASK